MRVVIDPNDQQFLEQLHRLCGGTVSEICDSVGVTATAIRQRLTRLEGQGLVVRETVRSGRGRPHHVYRVSDEGLRYLGENYRDLALILWRAIQQVENDQVRNEIRARIRDEFVERYGQIDSDHALSERTRRLKDELAIHGYDVEYIGDAELPVLREHSCPYQDLASADPSICEMEADVFSRILNAEVSLTQCCLDGHAHCEFHVREVVQPEPESRI